MTIFLQKRIETTVHIDLLDYGVFAGRVNLVVKDVVILLRRLVTIPLDAETWPTCRDAANMSSHTVRMWETLSG
jgi:hypothetical protein